MNIRPRTLVPLFCLLALLTPIAPAPAADTTDFYFIDIGFGNATLVVSPSGESMLLDTGTAGAVPRLLETAAQAGVKRIDYLVATHYHDDHFGAAAPLAEKIPVGTFVDHGPSVESGKDDAWWQARRGPWFKPGKGQLYDESVTIYEKAREKGAHLVVKAGDTIPLPGVNVQVLTAGGKIIAQPLEGAGQTNAAGGPFERRAPDDAEDAQSIGVLVRFGKFRFVYLGDLTWNEEGALFYPQDKVGPVDAYVVTHHAQSFPRAMGEYYWGLSACPPCELAALRPRVAILSLPGSGHRGGNDEAMKIVRHSPRLEDLWQTQKVIDGGEKDHNSPDDFIAFIGRRDNAPRYLKLSAHADGSFTMTNARNGFSKTYPALP
jgi:beta-lactamase superfamily II metal-dependent hydrolase